jgi:hypothetical protein
MRGLIACVAFIGAVGLSARAEAQTRRPETEPPQAAASPADIRVRSYLTRTAAWVGDPVDFVVEFDLAPGVELVTGDLAPEKLAIEGLDLGGSTSVVHDRADGWRTVRHAYGVTPWDLAPPKRIGALTVSYRRAVTTATSDGTAEAAEIVVPGATLAMRSTLPDDGSAAGARDAAAMLASPVWIGWLRPAGIGLIALGIAPVVIWIAARAARPRVSRPRASSRSLHSLVQSMWREVDIIDTETPDGRRRAFDRLDAGLRSYIEQAERLPARALTADELHARLDGARRVPSALLSDVLSECEVARYGPLDGLPSAESLASIIERLKNGLGRA